MAINRLIRPFGAKNSNPSGRWSLFVRLVGLVCRGSFAKPEVAEAPRNSKRQGQRSITNLHSFDLTEWEKAAVSSEKMLILGGTISNEVCWR